MSLPCFWETKNTLKVKSMVVNPHGIFTELADNFESFKKPQCC